MGEQTWEPAGCSVWEPLGRYGRALARFERERAATLAAVSETWSTSHHIEQRSGITNRRRTLLALGALVDSGSVERHPVIPLWRLRPVPR